jgi:hypothetical protein
VSSRTWTKWAKLLAWSVFVFVVVFFGSAFARKRAAELRTRDWIIVLLQNRFKSEVELADFHVRVFPRMEVSGKGLSLRDRGSDNPPLIRIEQFTFHLGFMGIFRAPHRIERIDLKRMVITIPPKRQRAAMSVTVKDARLLPTVTVGAIVCDNAELLMLSKRPDRDPLDWEIHHLALTEVGGELPFHFRGTLTNAKPKGEIATEGEFGPWDADDPAATPVTGSYGFDNADLGPFAGIAGILSSTGSYQGQLRQLEVTGHTDTPDFSLDSVGKKVPLHTDFSATVDGTNGDTVLHPVRAILGQSEIVASGSVEQVPAAKAHRITLNVTTPRARIEDILKLAMSADKPFLRGPVDINTKLVLPPGPEKVVDKMQLTGNFAITSGRWSSPEMREKLESFSRHAEGQPDDQDAGSAVTDLRGSMAMKNGAIRFSKLTFSVPGANIDLAGTYEVRSAKIDLEGHLKMQAKLSQTVTGVKSFFLKAVDPFYSKDGTGTVLPLSITGTQENPVIGVSVFHKKFEKRIAAVNP